MIGRRRRTLTAIFACVALLGLVFQVLALDHWTPAVFEEVRGIEHTDFHATHCHGALEGCAEGGGAPTWAFTAPAAVPLPPPARLAVVVASDSAPAGALPTELFHPPRAA